MPDANKLAALQDNQYRIVPTCAVCIHAQFVPGSNWGSCTRLIYQHLKHSGSKPVSIYRAGTCPKVEMHPDINVYLAKSGYDIFV